MSTPSPPGPEPEQPDPHREGPAPESSPPPPSYPNYPSAPTPQEGYPQQGAAGSYQPDSYPPQQDYPPQQSYPPGGGFQNYPAGYSGYPETGGGMVPPNDPLVPANFAGWFQRIVEVIRRSFQQLAMLQLIAALVSAVVGAVLAGASPDTSAYSTQVEADAAAGAAPDLGALGGAVGTVLVLSLVGGLISLVANAFVQSGSIYVAIRDAAGQPATASDGLRFSVGRALPLIGWGLLGGLIVGVGVVLLVIPGLYLAVVIFSSLYGVVVVERGGLGRCFALIKGRFWATTGRLVVAFLLGAVYYGVVHEVAAAIGGGPTGVFALILQAILMIPLGVATIAVVTVTYAELRFHENPVVSTPALAAEMVR
ncbi:MAG: hypothetical protein QOG76_7432 [Pseudonocardiales bacterium]|nr:hypothetical protein [Pseudonocardiales bacterium]